MRKRSLLFGAVLVVVAASAKAAPLPSELQTSVTHLVKSFENAERAVSEMDIAKLNIPYREGKRIESTRARVSKYAAMLRDRILAFRKSPSAELMIFLAAGVTELEWQIDILMRMLDDIDAQDLKTSELSGAWAATVNDLAAAVHTANSAFQSDLQDYARALDRRLDNR